MAFKKEIYDLALHAAKGRGYVANSETYSVEDVKDALKEELNKYVGNFYQFQKNKYDLFELISITIDQVLPLRVESVMGQFSEVMNLAQGTRAIFKKKLGRMRAKQFIGRVSPAGIYETFRLDTEEYELYVHAIGGGVRIDWERFLDGHEDWSELVDIVMEGLELHIYKEVALELIGSYNASGRPENTKFSTAAFDAAEMRDLIGVVRAYGQNAVIFATPEFVASMGDSIVYGPTAANPNTSPNDIEDLRTKGYIGIFHGAPIVMIPNAYEDESNSKFQLNPGFAFVMPTGGEKVVKVAFEGGTIVNDFPQASGDYSMEMMIYKKVGTAIVYTNNWGIYEITSLSEGY